MLTKMKHMWIHIINLIQQKIQKNKLFFYGILKKFLKKICFNYMKVYMIFKIKSTIWIVNFKSKVRAGY